MLKRRKHTFWRCGIETHSLVFVSVFNRRNNQMQHQLTNIHTDIYWQIKLIIHDWSWPDMVLPAISLADVLLEWVLVASLSFGRVKPNWTVLGLLLPPTATRPFSTSSELWSASDSIWSSSVFPRVLVVLSPVISGMVSMSPLVLGMVWAFLSLSNVESRESSRDTVSQRQHLQTHSRVLAYKYKTHVQRYTTGRMIISGFTW